MSPHHITRRRPRGWPTLTTADVEDRDGHDDGLLVDGRDNGRRRRRPMSTTETATTMAKVNARPRSRSPARRRHPPSSFSPYLRGVEPATMMATPVSTVIVVPAMMSPPSSVSRPPATSASACSSTSAVIPALQLPRLEWPRALDEAVCTQPPLLLLRMGRHHP